MNVKIWMISVALLALSMSAAAQDKPDAARPNIVFMIADNLGCGDLGSYGGGEVRGMPTPRIDQLASFGDEPLGPAQDGRGVRPGLAFGRARLYLRRRMPRLLIQTAARFEYF